jgi:hypothetical protein
MKTNRIVQILSASVANSSFVRIICCCVLFGFVNALIGQENDDKTPLQGLLARLELRALYFDQKLNELDREPQAVRRQREGQRLLKEFEAAALEHSVDQMPIDWRRLRALANDLSVPQSPALRLAFAASEIYEQHFDLLEVWKIGQQPANATVQLRGIERLISELTALEAIIENNWQSQQLDNPISAPDRQLEATYIQTIFLGGRMHLARELAAAQDGPLHLDLAAKKFSRLVESRPDDDPRRNRDWQRELSGLETNATLGLMVALIRQGKEPEADALTQTLLERGGETALLAEIWKLRLLTFKKTKNIDQHARQLFFNSRVVRHERRLLQAVFECAMVLREIGEPELSERLGTVGVARALSLRDQTAWQLVPKEIRDQASQNKFYKTWIHAFETLNGNGKGLMTSAQQTDVSDFKQNLTGEELVRHDSRDVVACLVLIGDLALSKQDFESVRWSVIQAQDFVRQHGLPADEQLEWLAVRSALETTRRGALDFSDAIRAVDEFEMKFPASRHLSALRLEQYQLGLSKLPAHEAVAVLKEQLSSGINDWQLRMLLIEELFREWQSRATLSRAEQSELLSCFEAATEDFLKNPDPPDTIRLRVSMLAHRVYWEAGGAKDTLVGEQRILFLAARLPEEHPLVGEALASVISSASKRGDQGLARQMAERLLRLPARTDLHEVARVAIAQGLESRVKNSDVTSPGYQRLVEELIDNYSSMLQGADDHQIRQRTNLQVTAVRLAGLLLESQRIEEARPIADILVRVCTEDAVALKVAADVFLAHRDLVAALEIYRRLGTGLQIGSEGWLAAKLGVVRCLAESNPQLAREVYAQVLDLMPQLSTEWQQAFEAAGFYRASPEL